MQGTGCGDTEEAAFSSTFTHEQKTLCSTGLVRHGHDPCESVEPLECSVYVLLGLLSEYAAGCKSAGGQCLG